MEFFPYRHCPLTHQMTHITALVLVEVGDSVSRPYLDCPRLYNLQRSSVWYGSVVPSCGIVNLCIPVAVALKTIVLV